jgi:hypothetical protein
MNAAINSLIDVLAALRKVSVMLDNDEAHYDYRNYELRAQLDYIGQKALDVLGQLNFEPVPVPVPVPSPERLRAFAGQVADTLIDGDMVNDEEHLADGNDAEVDALYALVRVNCWAAPTATTSALCRRRTRRHIATAVADRTRHSSRVAPKHDFTPKQHE